jgi:hypothetical protein
VTDPGPPFTIGNTLTEETRKILAQREKGGKKKKIPRAKK